MKNYFKVRNFFLFLAFLSLCACDKKSESEGTPPGSIPDSPSITDKINAANNTALQNNSCISIQPFYWEIGDGTGLLGSGSTGDGSIARSTILQIGSASKWIFASYVIQKLNGTLSPSIIKSLNFTSGYSNFTSCVGYLTVNGCYAGVTSFDGASNDKFNYSGGHMQKLAAVDLGIGTMGSAALTSEVQSYLGSDINLTFNIPQPAGGIQTTALGYSIFLRKIINSSLFVAQFLGSNATCTNSATCSAAVSTPIPDSESWSYSLGHWIENDPANGDSAYSSPGLYGFYPWINSSKTYYGLVARSSNSASAAWDSVLCGRKIRKAFDSGVQQ